MCCALHLSSKAGKTIGKQKKYMVQKHILHSSLYHSKPLMFEKTIQYCSCKKNIRNGVSLINLVYGKVTLQIQKKKQTLDFLKFQPTSTSFFVETFNDNGATQKTKSHLCSNIPGAQWMISPFYGGGFL